MFKLITKMLSRVIKPLYVIPIKRLTPHQLIVVRDKRLQNSVTRKSTGINIVDASYYVGKSIMLFTLFYCSMNWYHFKTTREDIEKYKDGEDGKNEKDK